MANFLDKDGLDYYTKGLAKKFAKTSDVPTKVSELTNDSGFMTGVTAMTNAEIDTLMGVA